MHTLAPRPLYDTAAEAASSLALHLLMGAIGSSYFTSLWVLQGSTCSLRRTYKCESSDMVPPDDLRGIVTWLELLCDALIAQESHIGAEQAVPGRSSRSFLPERFDGLADRIELLLSCERGSRINVPMEKGGMRAILSRNCWWHRVLA